MHEDPNGGPDGMHVSLRLVPDLAKSFDLVHGESLSLIMNLRTLEQLHKTQ